MLGDCYAFMVTPIDFVLLPVHISPEHLIFGPLCERICDIFRLVQILDEEIEEPDHELDHLVQPCRKDVVVDRRLIQFEDYPSPVLCYLCV